MERTSPALTKSDTIMSVFRSILSAMTPATGPNTTAGAANAKMQSPISIGDAFHLSPTSARSAK